jgi:hypothetical protein
MNFELWRHDFNGDGQDVHFFMFQKEFFTLSAEPSLFYPVENR